LSRFLALDWDAGHIHLLAGTVGKGGLKLESALAWPEEQLPTVANAEAFGQRVKERLREAGIAPAPLLVAVGRDRVILKEVRYPAVPAHEEPAVVRFQAVKELTDAADDVIIDYQTGDAPDPSGERKALAVAIRRDVVTAYKAVAKAAGVKLIGLAPRAFGILACLRRTANPAPEPGTAFAALAVGEKGGEFAVARGDYLAFARPLAGPALTSDAALLGEIRRNLAVYAGQAPQHPVRALYVAESAGPALGVGDRLRDTLAIPVFRFDPLGGLTVGQGYNAGSFAGAAGLLHLQVRVRGARDAGRLPIDFIHAREPKPPADPNRRLLVMAASIVGLLVLAGGAFGYYQVSKKERELAEKIKEKNELDEMLTLKYDHDERRIAAVDQWLKSEIVWADELYDLTARFPDINKLRLTEFAAEPVPLPPPQPGKTIDSSKAVAKVKLKGLSTEDDKPLSALMRELVKDASNLAPKQVSPNATGSSRRAFVQQWNTTYFLTHHQPDQYVRKFTATPPDRTKSRNRGRPDRGGPDVGDIDLFGGALP
jgi:Tfp pilus assembly PilM family ATPase